MLVEKPGRAYIYSPSGRTCKQVTISVASEDGNWVGGSQRKKGKFSLFRLL